MTVPLVAVAHGSRDPHSAETIGRVASVIRQRRPELDVREAFLDLSEPRLTAVLAALYGYGYRDAIVVPLLLGSAYHARVDLPGAVAAAAERLPGMTIAQSDVLGTDLRLAALALRRLERAGARLDDPELGIVLAATGSSHAPANAAVAEIAATLRQCTASARATAAFATAVPDVATAIAELRARGSRRIAVGSWFLAPGLLPSRVTHTVRAAEPDAAVAAPLGADPVVADVVLDRYQETLARMPMPVG